MSTTKIGSFCRNINLRQRKKPLSQPQKQLPSQLLRIFLSGCPLYNWTSQLFNRTNIHGRCSTPHGAIAEMYRKNAVRYPITRLMITPRSLSVKRKHFFYYIQPVRITCVQYLRYSSTSQRLLSCLIFKCQLARNQDIFPLFGPCFHRGTSSLFPPYLLETLRPLIALLI